MFEHLQDMDYSSSTRTREPIPQLPGLARLQRARFLGPVKNITSFPEGQKLYGENWREDVNSPILGQHGFAEREDTAGGISGV